MNLTRADVRSHFGSRTSCTRSQHPLAAHVGEDALLFSPVLLIGAVSIQHPSTCERFELCYFVGAWWCYRIHHAAKLFVERGMDLDVPPTLLVLLVVLSHPPRIQTFR